MARSSKVEITYTPRPGVGASDEISALVSVYAFVLRAHEQRNQGQEDDPATAPDDTRGESRNGSRAKRIIPK